MKPRVLVLLAYYVPGVKSGGPLRSISSLVEALGDEIDFRIVTTDRDKDDQAHYPNIEPNRWTRVGRAEVLYLSPDRLGVRSLGKIIAAEETDFLYVNSFFAKYFSIIPLLLQETRACRERSVVLAPRGEFSQGALNLHAGRKRAYIAFAKRLKTYRSALWHASSPAEEQDIRRVFGPRTMIRVALPMSQAASRFRDEETRRIPKTPGKLSVVFVARIVPMKNLLHAIEMLNNVEGEIDFRIYGPPEDGAYWNRCQERIQALPPNVHAEFRSLVPHSQVAEILSASHLLFLPTLGENYGHIIIESLAAGCPVLISDRTPWRNLEVANAGWDLPLERHDLFQQALEKCVAMNHEQFRNASASARCYARRSTSDAGLILANRALFLADPATPASHPV